jgi:diguanylate cyclase (GGDEF)-like protein
MLEHGTAAPVALDVTTLFIAATCVTALLGVFLLFAWSRDRIRALAWWGAAYLIGGFAAALWMVDPQMITLMPASLPSALLLLSCGMIWNAARLFHGRPILWVAMSFGALSWLMLSVWPLFAASGANRVILASLIVSAYTFLTAAELWRERRKALVRRWPALFLPALQGAVFLFPIPIAGMMPDSGLVTLAAGWLAVFVLETLLYAVGTAFVVLVLTSDRTLRMHKTAALTDPLTGLYNRRGLIEAARKLGAARRTKPVTVLAFDLDHFKSINDRFGHAVGDDVLRVFAWVANSSIRATDFVARLGGEEFAVVFAGTLDEGVLVAERVRVAFQNAGRSIAGRYIGATVSVGVAAHPAPTNIDALLARADEALYAAKAAGRNRVEAELPHVDTAPDAPAAATAPPAASDNTVEWSSYRRPRSAGREAA